MVLRICSECRFDKLETMYQSYSNNLTAIAICVSVLIAIMVIMTFIFGYYQPNKLMNELRELKSNMKDIEKKTERLDHLIEKYNDIEGMAFRSLYENVAKNSMWKFIWSIRYTHWFWKNNKKGLDARIKQALSDFDTAIDIHRIKKFENLGGLKNQLRELESSGDSVVSNTARQIITKFYNALNLPEI